jgi:hypothetical protein
LAYRSPVDDGAAEHEGLHARFSMKRVGEGSPNTSSSASTAVKLHRAIDARRSPYLLNHVRALYDDWPFILIARTHEGPQVKIIRLGDHYVDVHAPQEQASVSPNALRSFLSLMSEWEVSDADARVLLGRITSEEFAQLRAAPRVLDATQLKRIASLLSIHRELSLLYGTGVANQWVQLPNSHPMFCRVKPINYMLLGGVRAMSNVLRLLARRRRAEHDRTAQTE